MRPPWVTARRLGQPGSEGHATGCRALFDGKAAGWPGKYAPGGRLAGRLIQFADAVRTWLHAGGELLDLGCGSGELARHLAARRLPGDRLRHRARDAQPGRRRPTGGMPSAGCRLEPRGSTLPFAAGSLDAVVAASVLEYVPDPGRRACASAPGCCGPAGSCCAPCPTWRIRCAGWNGRSAWRRAAAWRARSQRCAAPRLGPVPDLPADLTPAAAGPLVAARPPAGRASARAAPAGATRARAAAPARLYPDRRTRAAPAQPSRRQQ